MATRRGFLKAMLAAGMAPAIVKAESLMKIVVPKKEIVLLDDFISGAPEGDMTSEMFTDTGDGWHHYAVTRSKDKVLCFKDGVLCSPEELKLGWAPLSMGQPAAKQHGPFGMSLPRKEVMGIDMSKLRGIDEIRVTQGVAREIVKPPMPGAGTTWREQFLRA